MAWKDVFSYVRGMADKRGFGAAAAGEATRADDGLPLGARIGSLVKIQQSPIIRAQANGSLIATLDAGEDRVLAVSQLKLEPHTELYRFYLAMGDDDGKEKFLQVFCRPDGAIAEILYCTGLARVIPESLEDQRAYTGEAGYGLGDAGYTLWREQLADMLSEAGLAAVFGDLDRIDFTRDAGARESVFVAPFRGQEIRIDDAQGKHGLRQQLVTMPYVRQLAGGAREILSITTEIVDGVDGDASRRDIHVDFVIGIPVEPERITVQ
ncbi:hypothetical protein [Massilia sp. 9096]|uniref:hypothetical protein n=1 Tax=Massilia sp. 9096 TaxID=1500894 RepID=UPI00056D4EDB|nr:hypothetical protein [Massilia sp. 9096]